MNVYCETPFALAQETLRASLPRRVELSDEDERKISIPDWRYLQIKDAIMEMFRKADVKFIPIEPMAIVQVLGCGPIPYRSLGRIALPVLMEASPDALTGWRMLGHETPLILYNDRKPPPRVAFSLMHELGHICLGHREHSKLAEKEANYFAANALCPLPMLEKSGLQSAQKVASCFAISEECAKNRLVALEKWKMLPESYRNLIFESELARRLAFKRPIQPFLLPLEAS